MAAHNELGRIGEDTAARYLMDKGYAILHRNWRISNKEIDIIAQKGKEVLFVEVKTRRNDIYCDPIEAITPQKARNLLFAVNAYLKGMRSDIFGRIDVITVLGDEPPFKIEHIENAIPPSVFTYR